MKRGKIVLLAAVFVALGGIAGEVRRVAYFLITFAMEPAGWGCDEGPVTDRSATNGRGDVVEEYERACTGFGTFVDHTIALQLHGDAKPTTLLEHGDPQYGYPRFRWLDDDTLMIDLSKSTVASP